MDEIVKKITELLVPVIAAALTALIVRLLKRVNIDIDAEKQAKLEHVTKLGVSYAEEAARAHFQNYGEKMPSTMKNQVATDFVTDKLPKVERSEVAKTVNAVMPEMREKLDPAPSATALPFTEPGKAPATL